MAKIIKVGSQNPTFTSQSKKAGSIQTMRNSNEATNPFKFTNFEGNTLQFADVFEGFKPTFKATPANKLRLVASSVTGSMDKMKSSITESVVNFANRIRSGASGVIGHIRSGWDYAKNTNISDIPGFKQMNELLSMEVNIPVIDGLSSKMSTLKENLSTKISNLGEKTSNWKNNLIANISLHGKNKYINMSVLELESELRLALAEGGINE